MKGAKSGRRLDVSQRNLCNSECTIREVPPLRDPQPVGLFEALRREYNEEPHWEHRELTSMVEQKPQVSEDVQTFGATGHLKLFSGDSASIDFAVKSAARNMMTLWESYPHLMPKNVPYSNDLYKILRFAIKKTTVDIFEHAMTSIEISVINGKAKDFDFVPFLLWAIQNEKDKLNASISDIDSLLDPIPVWTTEKAIADGTYTQSLSFHELSAEGAYFGFRLPSHLRASLLAWCEVLQTQRLGLRNLGTYNLALRYRTMVAKMSALRKNPIYRGIKQEFITASREIMKLRKKRKEDSDQTSGSIASR